WEGVFERMASELRRKLAPPPRNAVAVAISPGELIDKITILEIKAERLTDPAKLGHVRVELEALRAARERDVPPSPALAALRAGRTGGGGRGGGGGGGRWGGSTRRCGRSRTTCGYASAGRNLARVSWSWPARST